MATERRFSNRVGQQGVFNTGTPDEVDITSAVPLTGMVTFADAAASDSWVDGDEITVLIKVDDDNYLIWTAEWDEANDKLLKVTEEMSIGTVADEDVVEVSAVLSQTALFAETRLMRFVLLDHTGHTVTADDCGKTIRMLSSEGAQDITIPDGLPVGFWFNVVQANSDVANIEFSGSDDFTMFTSTTGTSGQWTMITVYKYNAAQWDCIATSAASV
jgi:hypothetical protein